MSAFRPNGRIPAVDKTLLVGVRGGLYYINSHGRKTHLGRRQRRACVVEGTLDTDKGNVCARVRVHTTDLPPSSVDKGFVPRYGRVFLDT